jgi:hypothetical protein
MPKRKYPKGTYDITVGDLAQYTGAIEFDKHGEGKLTSLKEDFPTYNRNDPRTYVMVTHATLRAALGHDYIGEQVLPPYVAYPPKLVELFRNHLSRTSNAATEGKYHRLYPHNCDVKGRMRKEFGMSGLELAVYLGQYGDAVGTQPKRAGKKERSKNEEKWRESEAAEKRREEGVSDTAEAEQHPCKTEQKGAAGKAKDSGKQRHGRKAKPAPGVKNATKKSLGKGKTPGTATSGGVNGKKRSASDSVSSGNYGIFAKRAKLTATVKDASDSDTASDSNTLSDSTILSDSDTFSDI